MFALVPLSTKLGRRRRWKDGALAWLEEDCLFVTNVHGLPLPWILFPLGATCRETASLKFCYWKLPLYRYNPIDLSNLVQRMHLVFLYPWVSGRDCAGGFGSVPPARACSVRAVIAIPAILGLEEIETPVLNGQLFLMFSCFLGEIFHRHLTLVNRCLSKT